MPSSVVRRPTRRDVKVQSEQELEFDRWRTAVDIVRRMREACWKCLTIYKTGTETHASTSRSAP